MADVEGIGQRVGDGAAPEPIEGFGRRRVRADLGFRAAVEVDAAANAADVAVIGGIVGSGQDQDECGMVALSWAARTLNVNLRLR